MDSKKLKIKIRSVIIFNCKLYQEKLKKVTIWYKENKL